MGTYVVIFNKWPSFVWQIVEVLVNRELSDGSINWPQARRRYYTLYPLMRDELDGRGHKRYERPISYLY